MLWAPISTPHIANHAAAPTATAYRSRGVPLALANLITPRP